MSIDKNDINSLIGADVLTADNNRLGDVGQVYVDDESGSPEWVTVRTGLFGTKETFVPIRTADFDERGLRVPFEKKVITDAPRVEADQGHLSPEEEDELYRYYGISDQTGSVGGDYRDTDAVGGVGTGTAGGDHRDTDTAGGDHRDTDAVGGVGTGTAGGDHRDTDADPGDARGTVGHDTSGPTTDDAMTRSEERLRVGKQSVETGRARLRKHVVTEQQTVQVPVEREEVTIEREPITDANRAAAGAGPELSEEEHEVVLHEERPVVEKDVVATERVRLGKQNVEDETTVSEQVRKEEIDADTDGDTGRSR